jgi:alkanesulfonate monooxygenase SsuD/methylene tetrahydromethanopterin reductase-like flavin-dependent oxidoreductase (luciferase family)
MPIASISAPGGASPRRKEASASSFSAPRARRRPSASLSSRDLWRLRLDQGILGPIPPVEEALSYQYSEGELTRLAYNRRRQVVGTPEQVKERLIALARDYAVDELVVVSICFDFAARLRSYKLLAEAFGRS